MTTQILNAALYCLKGVHDDRRIEATLSNVCIRHCSNFVIYRKSSTVVPISVFGHSALSKGRRVFLQKRGYRTGLLGWSIGTLLGGTWGKEIEITPVTSAKSLSAIADDILSSSFKATIQREIDAVSVEDRKGMALQQTLACHIPASSGDGYFRLRVTEANSMITIATTPTFRILSSSLSTVSPRGATIFQLPIEAFAATSIKTAQVGAWGTFYALFPFLKLASWMPGGISQSAINALWKWAGGQESVDEVRERYKVDDRIAQASEMRDRAAGAVGVRTDGDVKIDTAKGRQGAYVIY